MMDIKVFQLKIQANRLNQKQFLYNIFLEVKHTKGLSFVSEVNSVSFRQFSVDWKFDGTKIKLSKCKMPFKVFGLEQLNIEGIEFANGLASWMNCLNK